jgi:uncharacterized protein YkwD
VIAKPVLIFFVSFFIPFFLLSQVTEESIARITFEVNQVRQKGVKCGDIYMPAVNSISWRNDLFFVSSEYARYMYDNSHFGHLSMDGKDAGDRLDLIGYKWQYVGENLAVGQHDFPEVLEDWLESESHCKMLMNPNMQHFAVARYKEYWVQTFASLFESN